MSIKNTNLGAHGSLHRSPDSCPVLDETSL